MPRRLWFPLLGMAGGAMMLAAAGCGSSASSAPPSSAKASKPAATTSAAPKLRTVTFRLDWIPEGYEAPFVYGAAQGIFKKYGINLKWAWGNGSAAAVEYVDAGKVMFANGDANSVLNVDAKGGHVKAVFGYMQENPDSVIVPANSPIKTVQDLKGKSVASSAGSSTALLFPALLHAAGLTPSEVHIDNMSASAKTLALYDHKVDAELNYGFEVQPTLAAKGFKTRLINYASYGVNPINLVTVTTDQMIQQHPHLVKAFVEAEIASVAAAKAHPRAAEEAVIKYAPGHAAPPLKVLLQQWTSALKLLQTPNDAGHPLGWMAKKDWQDTQSLGLQYLGQPSKVSLSQVYTNQFIPSGTASSGGY